MPAALEESDFMENENTAKKLFGDFKPASYEEWHAEAVKLLKGAPFEKKMLTKTPEGIVLKPIYNKEDIDFDTSLPGFDDFLRGTSPLGNKCAPWKISQEIAASTPEEFNLKILDALSKGQNSLEIVLDNASANGIDADNAESVGENGHLSISNASDWRTALRGVFAECVDINIHTQSAAAGTLAAFFASRENPDAKISGGIYFDPLGNLASKGSANTPLEKSFDEMFKMASFAATKQPMFGVIGVDAARYNLAGASAVEELGAAFATAVLYIREMLSRGLSIDDIAPLMRFRFALGSNFFTEIAKFRAARVVWARIISEFGGNENSRKIRINARTSLFNKTMFDPYVNMLRTATETFEGALAQVDSITVGAFDEIIRRPDEFSERVARNQQIVLQQECNLCDVIDPAGGSYYVETLTRQIEQKAWDFFVEIESEGGMLEALKKGVVQNAIGATFAERKKLIDQRRNSVVGTNNYANLAEKPLEVKPSPDVRQARAHAVAVARTQTKVDTTDMAHLVASAANGASVAQLQEAVCPPLQGKAVSVAPLSNERAVAHFEALRKASAAFKAKTGNAPRIFLATMGPLVQHKARADFIRGFFQAGGFDVLYPNGFETPQDAADAFAQSNAEYAVICSTDDTYPQLVPPVATALKRAKPAATVLLAGVPAPEEAENYRKAGLDGSISIKSNNFETLKSTLQALGVL